MLTHVHARQWSADLGAHTCFSCGVFWGLHPFTVMLTHTWLWRGRKCSPGVRAALVFHTRLQHQLIVPSSRRSKPLSYSLRCVATFTGAQGSLLAGPRGPCGAWKRTRLAAYKPRALPTVLFPAPHWFFYKYFGYSSPFFFPYVLESNCI